MVLWIDALGLVGLTFALIGPASEALARARWTARSPRAALVLWQAVGLASGLGLLTIGLTLVAGSEGGRWLPGLAAVPSHWNRVSLFGWMGVALTGCVAAWLIGVTIASTVRVLGARRTHRHRLDAIADAWQLAPAGARGRGLEVRLVDHPRAVAYCLPGVRPRVVVSRGTLAALSGGELAAVLAHEQAHARGRHDLVTQPFLAWAQTFPFLPTASRAADAVSLLVEMLADDAALHDCRPEDLRSALRHLARESQASNGAANSDLRHRLSSRADRLSAATDALSRPVVAVVYAVAAIIVLAPPIALACT